MQKLTFLLLLSLWSTSMTAQSCKAFKKEINTFRAKYKADFLKEERSPFYHQQEKLAQLQFYKPKKKYRVSAQFVPAENAEPFEMATYSGMVKPYVKYGTLHFEFKGKKQKIAVYQSLRLREMEEYKDYLFIPFKDYTNGEQTYGGGRYIDLRMSDIQNNQVILDFNKCYNPWCAFSDGYNCPVPPLENHLPLAIKAGEKEFGGEKKH